MKNETLDFIFNHAENRDPKEAAESLTYLCSMLWLCRSDKINESIIPFLADITNSVIVAHDEFSDLEPLSFDSKDYRIGHSDIYFQNQSHSDIKRKTEAFLIEILCPPKQKPQSVFDKIKRFF